MNYVSPYDILSISPDVIPDRAFLLNAKKVLLAKLELSGQSTITEHGKEYAKNDIEQLFDQLFSESHWAYHQEIEKNPPLKLFLQQGVWNKPFTGMPQPQEEGFYFFIADWYASSYQHVVLKSIRENTYVKLKNFLYETHVQKQFIGQDKLVRLQFDLILEIKIIVAELLDFLEEDRLLQRRRLKQLRPYYDELRIACLNLLPEETFQEVRNEYGLALCGLFIELNNELKVYSEAGEIMRNLRALKLTARAQYEFKRCYEFYNQRYLFGGYGKKIRKAIGIALVVCLVFTTLVNMLPTKNRNKPGDDTLTVNAELRLDSAAHVRVVPVDEVLKKLRKGADISYFMDQHLVENPEMAKLISSKAYMDIRMFYLRGGEGYKTKFEGVVNNITPLTRDPVSCFETAYPGQFIGSPDVGDHQIKITNRSQADFLAFLFTEEGYFSVKHIQPEMVTVLKTNEEKIILMLAGGGELSAVHRGEMMSGNSKKTFPAFVIPYESLSMKACVVNSSISYKDTDGTSMPGLGKCLDYSYSINLVNGRVSEITQMVTLSKKYKPQ